MLRMLIAFVCFVCAELASVPPAPLQNYVPLVVVNNTGQPAANVYFMAHGLDLNGIPCFLVPDTNGICSYSYPTPSGENGSYNSSVALSSLPLATSTPFSTNAYLIYMPINISSRAYISINSPLYLPIQYNSTLGVLGIGDPSVGTYSDPNIYTLYQDVELVYEPGNNNKDSSAELFIDISYVDYFCLPMQMYMLSYPSGNLITQDPVSLPSGTIASMSRGTLLSSLNTMLSPYPYWSNLGLYFYSNAYVPVSMQNPSPITVRYLAAKNSISLAQCGITFQFPAGSTYNYPMATPQLFQTFPPTFLTSSSTGPQAGVSYMQSFYNYYKTHSFYVFITPGLPDQVVYEITSDATNLQLDFNCVLPTPTTYANYSVLLGNSDTTAAGIPSNGGLTTENFLAGASNTWNFLPSGSGANEGSIPPELAKALSALFTIGYWPYPYTSGTTITGSPCSSYILGNYPTCPAGSTSCPFYNSNCGYANLGAYFPTTQSPQYPLPPTGSTVFYNLYAQVVHMLEISSLNQQNCPTGVTCTTGWCSSEPGGGCVPNNPGLGLGYAFDYDDLLNMSGTIGGLLIQDVYGNPANGTGINAYGTEPYCAVVMGAVETDTIPVLFTGQPAPYKVWVGPAPGGTTVTFTFYETAASMTPTQVVINSSTNGNTELGTGVYVSPTQPFLINFSYSGAISYDRTYMIDLQRQVAIPQPEATGNNSFTSTDAAYQGSITFIASTPATQSSYPGIPLSTEGNPVFIITYASNPPAWPG